MQRTATVLLLLFGLGAANAGLLSGVTGTVGSTVGAVGTTVNNLLGGSSSSGSSSTGTTGQGSAQADPQVVDFSGRHFEFIGQAGSFYNVIQDAHHQVSMRLKIGVLSDHIGTYIDGIGFAYQGHKIVIELLENDHVLVNLDGARLTMAPGENMQEHDMVLPEGKLRVTWELYRPNFGNTITIQTDLLRFTVYRTDKGSLDKGGLPQPAFLNFDAELLFPPAHGMEGVVGEGYTRVLNGEAHTLPDDGTFYGNPDDYLLPHYFPANIYATQKTLLPSAGAYRRHLMAPVQAQEDITLAAEGLDSDGIPIGRAGGENVLKGLYMAMAGGN